jgi:phosphoribosylanthranilate isomerase
MVIETKICGLNSLEGIEAAAKGGIRPRRVR